jgi:hypothetical protein
MLVDAPDVWLAITRWGEAQIMLPVALLLALWLAWRGRLVKLAAAWLLALAGAVGLTVVSKVAFIAYGWGFAPLDYTGISGHSMFAAAIYPVSGVVAVLALGGERAAAWRTAGLAAGIAIALLVGVSRIVIGAHSVIEVALGLGAGGLASAAALGAGRLPVMRSALGLPIVLALWLGVTPAAAPPSDTHGLVTQLALSISGHRTPYTRADMHSDWLQRQAAR